MNLLEDQRGLENGQDVAKMMMGVLQFGTFPGLLFPGKVADQVFGVVSVLLVVYERRR